MADFSTTVYATAPVDTETARLCDPFWTMMNGGFCSDVNGNYIRKDGKLITFENLTQEKQLIAGVSNSALLVFALVLVGVAVVARRT